MDLTQLKELGLPIWVLIFIALVVVVAYLINKLKDAGVGGFITERVRNTVDFSQEQRLMELDGRRQDAIAMLTENAHLTELQSQQVTKLIDHLIAQDREWHSVHDTRYRAIADQTTAITYLVKQIAEKITVLISVVEGLYDRMKSHRNDEIAELKLQLEQSSQYIAALESRIEMREEQG